MIAPIACTYEADTHCPVVGQIMACESGELEAAEVVELFQRLVDSGLAWQLQGHYGRTAARLIDAGEIHS